MKVGVIKISFSRFNPLSRCNQESVVKFWTIYSRAARAARGAIARESAALFGDFLWAARVALERRPVALWVSRPVKLI